MMKITSVAAVVVTSLASFWLAGCAGDASSPTSDDEEGTIVTQPTSANGTPVGESSSFHPSNRPAGANADEEGTALEKDQLIADKKLNPHGGAGEGDDAADIEALDGASLNTAGDDGCSTPGEVMCSCGVCAGIQSCIRLCQDEIPRK